MLRGTGITASERYLKKLCDRSFLSLWSHAGLFNNKSPGKELCDLLVIFEDHLIIFSDKEIAFPRGRTMEERWRRWYRKAIIDSAKQVFGAERWILNHPNRIFLDQAGKVKFPLLLPTDPQIHRIVVTRSISEHCREFFGGGSGSLIFDSDVIGDERPFSVGHLNRQKGIVHILDDSSLEILLGTLDTAPDFIDYLTKKETFLSSRSSVVAAGEEEFLAHFLTSADASGNHDFLIEQVAPRHERIIFDEGHWGDFSKSSVRETQVRANRISYYWDSLIESVSTHVWNGTAYASSTHDLVDHERLLRLLAKENRTQRRFLADAFLHFVEKTPPGHRSTRTIFPSESGKPYYVFFVMPYPTSMDYKIYREVRHKLLIRYCSIVRLERPDAFDIIGIGTETGLAEERSEDIVYVNSRNWTSKDFDRVRRDREYLRKKGFIGANRIKFKGLLYEYPERTRRVAQNAVPHNLNLGRNARCHCGSGRKFKKCHGATA